MPKEQLTNVLTTDADPEIDFDTGENISQEDASKVIENTNQPFDKSALNHKSTSQSKKLSKSL
jgi:hypothetical protein